MDLVCGVGNLARLKQAEFGGFSWQIGRKNANQIILPNIRKYPPHPVDRQDQSSKLAVLAQRSKAFELSSNCFYVS
jgi:hypothetical protein